MFDGGKNLSPKELAKSNAKLAEALITVIGEVQVMAKEMQKLRIDVDKLIENQK